MAKVYVKNSELLRAVCESKEKGQLTRETIDMFTLMIDGISKIMQNDIEFASENGYNVSEAATADLKKRLIQFYTIQDQRDYADGQDDAMQGCNIEQPNMEEFLLF